jgi:hypothetical protein
MKKRGVRPDPAEDARPSLALRRAETAALCRGCVKCCTSITVEIDAPRTPWEYDQWISALHHGGVQLYLEQPERWSLHFETRCARLAPDRRWAIHGGHPVTCRGYDPRTCERWLRLADIRAWFDTPGGFEDWIQAERPGRWARLQAWRRGRGAAADASRPRRTAVIPSRGSASTARSG